jgi:aerobic C4-dicarboxylate transport protein
MSEARALTNLIGNGVATVVVSRWENELDLGKLQRVLDNKSESEVEMPELEEEPFPVLD